MEANPVEVFRDQLINRRDFAALSSTTVKIPGIASPPAPGQYYASPALQRLIESRHGTSLATVSGSLPARLTMLPCPDRIP